MVEQDDRHATRIRAGNHAFTLNATDPHVEDCLRQAGFLHVSRIGIVPHFISLMSVVCECCRPEMNTFHLPSPVLEATITLEDVALLFGLPIYGDPVTSSVWETDIDGLCERLLPRTELRTRKQGRTLDMHALATLLHSTELTPTSSEDMKY